MKTLVTVVVGVIIGMVLVAMTSDLFGSLNNVEEKLSSVENKLGLSEEDLYVVKVLKADKHGARYVTLSNGRIYQRKH